VGDSVSAWDPTAQQVEEPDTLWMPDLTSTATLNASGGLLEGLQHHAQADAASGYVFGSGKYGPSIQPDGSGPGRYFYVPTDGLLKGDQFTLEFFASNPTVNWNTIRGDLPLVAIVTPTLTITPTFFRDGSGLNVTVVVLPGTPAAVTTSKIIPLSAINFAANVWVSMAFVLNGSTLQTLINGVAPTNGQLTGLAIPPVISDTSDNGGGLRFGGSNDGPTGFAFSDIRLSRTARSVGVAPTLKTLTGTIAIDTADVAGDVPAGMIGALHGFLPATSASLAGAVMEVYRTGKFLTCTPIKAGGTDGTHPTLGASGSYSYDWQVVDRELDRLAAAGIKINIGMDSIPELLGGSVAPFTGTDLTAGLPYYSGYAPEVPTSLVNWATMVGDLVHHVNAHAVEVVAYSALNEPDGGAFWAGTMTEAMNFYAATADAIRAADPDTPIIGAELATDPLDATWVNALVAKHVATGCPLDGFTYHDYSGDIRHPHLARALLDAKLVANGLTAGSIPLYVTEFNWNIRKVPVSGNADPTEDYLHFRAFGAAYMTAFIINLLNEADALDARGLCFTKIQGGDPLGFGDTVFALLGPNDEQWATYNAMLGLRSVLGDERLTLDADLPPGVFAYASHDTTNGRVGIALASYGWANLADRAVNVDITGLSGLRRVRHWVVDETHSSPWDELGEDAIGETGSGLAVVSDTAGAAPTSLSVTVPQWGSVFVLIEAAPVSKLMKLNGNTVLLP
jgi:hypothetical protein